MEDPAPVGLLRVNEPGFVLGTYAAVLLPWSVLYSHDFISERWKTVRNTRRAGRVHLALVVAPMAVMVTYVHYQRLLKDYKEMSMGIVAIFVSIYHFVRTVWGLIQLEQFRLWAVNAHENLARLKFKVFDPTRVGGDIDLERDEEESADWLLVNSTLLDNEILGGHSPPVMVCFAGAAPLLTRLRGTFARKSMYLLRKANVDVMLSQYTPYSGIGSRLYRALAFLLFRRGTATEENPCSHLARVWPEAIDFGMTAEGASVLTGADIGKSTPERRVGGKSALSYGREKAEYEKGFLRMMAYPRLPEATWVKWSVAFLSQRCSELLKDTPKEGQSIEMSDQGRLIIGFCLLQDVLPISTWRTFSDGLFEPALDGGFVKSLVEDEHMFAIGFSLRHAFLEAVFEQGKGLPFDFPCPVAMQDNKFLAVDTEKLLSESIAALPRKYFSGDDFIRPSHLEFFAIITHGFDWRDFSGGDLSRRDILEALGLRLNVKHDQMVVVELKESVSRLLHTVPSQGYLDYTAFKEECENLDAKVDDLDRRMTKALGTLREVHSKRLKIAEEELEMFQKCLPPIREIIQRVEYVETSMKFSRNQSHITRLCLQLTTLIQIVHKVSGDLSKGHTRRWKKLNPGIMNGAVDNLFGDSLKRHNSDPNMARAAAVSSNHMGPHFLGQTARVRTNHKVLQSTLRHGTKRRVVRTRLALQPEKARTRASDFVDIWIALRNGAECVELIKKNEGKFVDNIETVRCEKHTKCSKNDNMLRKCTNESLRFEGDYMRAVGEALMQFCQTHGGPISSPESRCIPHVCASLHPLADSRIPHPSDVKEFEVGKDIEDEIGKIASTAPLPRHSSKHQTPVYLRLHILRLLQDACREKCRENGHTSAWAIMACMLAFPALECRELCGPCVRDGSRGNGNAARWHTASPDVEFGRVSREGKERRQVALLLEFEPVQAPANLHVRVAFEYENDGTGLVGRASVQSSDRLRPDFDWLAWIDEFEKRSGEGRKDLGVRREIDANILLSTSRVRIGEKGIVYRWDAWPGAPVVDFEKEFEKEAAKEVDKEVGDDGAESA